MRVLWLALFCSACPAPRAPTPPAGAITLEVGRDGASLRGVAANATHTFVALTTGDQSTIEARRTQTLAWSITLAGQASAVAASNGVVYVALSGSAAGGVALRGEPGSVVVALDAATGATKWQRAIDASEWSIVTGLAANDGGVVVGGSFGGTLRVDTKIVSSAGKADGFVARLAATGTVGWLVRVGGVNTDSVNGVALADDRIAIAGVFAPGADLLGTPLVAFDDRTPRTDGFVAELAARDGSRRWSQTFGGKLDDSVVGVTIDGAGRVAVAASVRDVVKFGITELVARGDADGAVGWWSKDGQPGAAILLGGPEVDGVRAIAAAGSSVVVGGFFSGTIRLGARKLTAGGGDDAFLAAFDHGASAGTWAVTGEGREEIAALASVPGGIVAGITHTARADIEGAALAAPKDPMSGAALVIRAVGGR